jgi:hypothetical protein
VIAKALSQQREPPSDYDLEVQLNTVKPAQMAPVNRKPQDSRTGKRDFEAAFRENHANLPILLRDEKGHVVRKNGEQFGEPIVLGYGRPVPEHWEKTFARWKQTDATDEQLGRELLGGALADDGFLKDDPFDALPAKMPEGKRAEVESQLASMRARSMAQSGIDIDEWNKGE